MKHFPIILTVIRFIAVAAVLYFAYALIIAMFIEVPNIARADAGVVTMMQKAKSSALLACVKGIAGGVLLYLFAPVLSRIITVGSDGR